MLKTQFWILGLVAIFFGCSHHQPGFIVPGSFIRFETKKFEDPEVLAEVQGQKYLASQILDKSSVMKDLENQKKEALVAIAYKQVLEKSGTTKPKGTVEIYVPQPERPLTQVLSRIGVEPVSGVTVSYKKSDDANVLARFGETQLTYDDVGPNNFLLLSIKQRELFETASQLSSQLSRILVSAEASKQKMSFQDFLNKEVLKSGEGQISPQEVESYAISIGLAPSELNDELRGRFTDSLKERRSQRAVERYAANHILQGPIQVSFSEPHVDLKAEDLGELAAGYKDAPVSLVVIGNASCQDCTRLTEVLRKFFSDYDGYLRLNWIHNYSPMDGVAELVSKGALCVGAQRAKLSLIFMNDLGKRGGQISEAAIYDWAQSYGLNEAKFKTCFSGGGSDDTLKKNIAFAQKSGVVANPTVLVEGYLFEGMIAVDRLDTLVKEKVAQSGENFLSVWIRKIKGWL